MGTEEEKRQWLYEQEKIKETLATPGARIIALKLRQVARGTYKTEAKADPFLSPGEIMKARQLRYVLTTLLPQTLEGMVNYDPESLTRTTPNRNRWTVFSWLKDFFKRRKAGKVSK